MNKSSTLDHRLPLETLLRVIFSRNFGAVLVCVCVVGGGELKAVYGRKKKTIFQELALYQGESRSGLFIEWFSKAKALTQETRTKYANEKHTIIHLWGRKK